MNRNMIPSYRLRDAVSVVLLSGALCTASSTTANPAANSSISQTQPTHVHPFGWDHMSPAARPTTFWWWLGSCVNEAEISRQLRVLKDAGFGGVLICPLYSYEAPKLPSIPYLSPQWVDMLKFTLQEAASLDLTVDITMGSGWPMGGPWITREHSERYLRLEKIEVDASATDTAAHAAVQDQDGKDPIVSVTEIDDYSGSRPGTLVAPDTADGKRQWRIAPGRHKFLIARMGYTNFNLYVAGPGGEGPVFDYWSPQAFENLVKPFDEMFQHLGKLRPRAVFCDSYEGRGGGTPAMFDEFQRLNGYDLRPYLHFLLAETKQPENARVWHDYRAMIAGLHVQFTSRWTQWANKHGVQTLYQWTGDPANGLDTCAQVSIPDAPPFATTAARMFGKPIVSSETFTWGAGHNFIGSLDWLRGVADSGVFGGVNQAMYHGTPFTPRAEPWPGPMYYAGANFSENQPWFPHLRYLNTYLGRLQQILQTSTGEPDVLVLNSMHDWWNSRNEGGWTAGQPLVWRNSEHEGGYTPPAVNDVTSALTGFQPDMCSDAVLAEHATVSQGMIEVGQMRYRVLVVPALKSLESRTLEKLTELGTAGAQIVFVGKVPTAVPHGLPLVQDTGGNHPRLRALVTAYAKGGTVNANVWSVPDSKALMDLMVQRKLPRESIPGMLSWSRLSQGTSTLYILKNNADGRVDVWVPLLKSGERAFVGNPRTGESATAAVHPRSGEGIEVHLVFEPAEVLVVLMGSKELPTAKPMNYAEPRPSQVLTGPWDLKWSDYDGATHGTKISALRSWTDLADLGLFSGVVRYETHFKIDDTAADVRWLLDAGVVHESAEVWVNGQPAGCVWTKPFQLDVTSLVRTGDNAVVFQVANLAQNRIIELERKGVKWKKWPLSENDFKGYAGELRLKQLKPLDSGLIGPVRLLGVEARTL